MKGLESSQSAGEPQLSATFVPQPTAAFFDAVQAFPQPQPIPTPIPIPFPFLFGSRVLIWKQDPSVPVPGIRRVYLPGLILNGPRDARIRTELPGTTPVNRNSMGDFIFSPGTAEFDSAHTFAVVRQTLTMFERARNGTRIPWAWNSGGNTDALSVFPRAGVTANAFYSRSQKAVKFFFFTPSGAPTPVFTCRSLDIVSHEAGHAILDGLKPGWLAFGNPPQTGGLHESFGDLSAIFLALSQLDQVEAIIAITKANLHAKNFLAALAEQFGTALGRPMGLRNADNNLKLSEVSNQVHAISQVFTGGIYDVLADIFSFQRRQQRRTKDPAQVLLEVGQHLCGLVLNALIAAPDTAATYADVVNQMISISHAQGDPAIYRTFIRNRFAFREVVVSPTPITSVVNLDDPQFCAGEDPRELEPCAVAVVEAPQDRSTCCGTMQQPEYMAEQEDLAAGKSVGEERLLGLEQEELKKAFK